MFHTFPKLQVIFIYFTVSTTFSVKAIFHPDDNYSFVALLDIVLSAGGKRTCTGTIIHDTVVITAAHCFSQEDETAAQTELTASFIVVGTKKMFDTGYEQYFPIERVVIHPKYSQGWTADLALVFTFASMVSDKPGRVVPLINDHLKQTAVDANVTVLSWGVCEAQDAQIKRNIPPEVESEASGSSTTSHEQSQLPLDKKRKKPKKRYKIKSKAKQHNYYDHSKREQPRADPNDAYFLPEHLANSTFGGQYEDYDPETEKSLVIPEEPNIISKLDIRKDRSAYLQTTDNVMLNYKNNWRRKMGTEQNKLTIEVFSLVNVASCKKIIDKGKQSLYRVQNINEIICYANDDRYVTDEDSGAPAMRHAHLVGVTVGGAEFDGDHVAVAIKVSCFCPWIAEHLPDGGPNMQCCTNCCNVQPHSEEYSEERSLHHSRKRRKKILRK